MMVKKWILKAVVQKAISLLPARNRINLWFQRNVTRAVALEGEHLHWKLTHARDHIAYWRRLSRTSNPVCLELGTGWYPIVPIMLYLHGARRVLTVDLNGHLTADTLRITLDKLIQEQRAGRLEQQFPGIQSERWLRLERLAGGRPATVAQDLAVLEIEAIVGDARRLDLPDNSIDFICSNNTFEHIYPEVLRSILLEFKRVIKEGGVMSHFIDLSDHFAHFDPSITIYNFLRFSERQWSWIDNDIQPQNRRRWPQYEALYRSLELPVSETAVRPGDPALLAAVSVHPEWHDFSAAELAISHGYLVSCC